MKLSSPVKPAIIAPAVVVTFGGLIIHPGWSSGSPLHAQTRALIEHHQSLTASDKRKLRREIHRNESPLTKEEEEQALAHFAAAA